jgi:uncharacterized iron-regulated membrane protein
VNLRRVVFWLHLGAGSVAGAVVLTMSVTGALLAFERQITAWAERDQRRLAPPAGAARLPVEVLLAGVLEARPAARPTGLTVRSDPAEAAAVVLGRDAVLYADPYTGRVLGEGSPATRGFFHAVTDWHRWLGAHGPARDTARAVTAACNLAFLFLVASGFYLWWPREWSPQFLRPALTFQRGLTGRARDFNWHNVIGFFSALPLFVVVLCAVVISYPWANDLVYRVTGNEPPPPRVAGTSPGAEAGGAPPPPLAGLDRLWARAEQQVPGWRSITMRLPAAGDPGVGFTIDLADGSRPDRRAQLTLHRETAEPLGWEPFASYNLGRQLRLWVRWVHTGEAGGFVGQVIAAAASIGGALLVYTGLALACRRFAGWAARRLKAPARGPAGAARRGDMGATQENA